ncbi:MAG TPA: SDR family oxidoreductase [bacterium]|nr:SDR family oxidoreductase [bacterium]
MSGLLHDFPAVRRARFLVTGGGGFIGSNIVSHLCEAGAVVRVLDDFSSGKRANLADDDVEILEGDVRDPATTRRAVEGMDFVLHQAAIPSVPRSVERPRASHDVNVTGTINVLLAARDAGVRRVVLASSSSVYGESEILPKHEGLLPSPVSPYAANKISVEHYAAAFRAVYGLQSVALRYFNVFGPRQDPESAYAAVIPRFIASALAGAPIHIFGDGEQTRDFTFVTNVVRANVAACFAPNAPGNVINIATGRRSSIRGIAECVIRLTGSHSEIRFEPVRTGDILHSWASIEKAVALLGYAPWVSLDEGLERTIEWHREQHRLPPRAEPEAVAPLIS